MPVTSLPWDWGLGHSAQYVDTVAYCQKSVLASVDLELDVPSPLKLCFGAGSLEYQLSWWLMNSNPELLESCDDEVCMDFCPVHNGFKI